MDDKVYKVIDTRADWIEVFGSWWNPELKNICLKYNVSIQDVEYWYNNKDYEKVSKLLNNVWNNAPDSPIIHLIPGWGILCELCSERGVL
jgi:hypothetical protein